MIVGHKYKITYYILGRKKYGPVTIIGTYNGIETDVNSYVKLFGSFHFYNANSSTMFISRSYCPLLNFNIEHCFNYTVYSDTVISIEDVTNPYFCNYKPMLYDISSPVDERVKFAVLDKRVSVHDMIHPSTCTSVLMRSVRFDVVDYCMIKKNRLWYGKKRCELFDKPGLVLISR